MSNELNFGLADLEITDDLNVSMDNETYQDQANPAPPVAGNYGAKAVKIEPAKNKNQEPIFENSDPRFPIFRLQTVELVDGVDSPRKVAIFQDIKTKPFDRYGSASSQLGDITRAYGTESWQGIRAGLELLQEAAQQGNVFYAQYDWSVYDKAFIDAALVQFELKDVAKDDRTDEQKKLLNAVYKAGRVTGMGRFPFNEKTGKFSHVLPLGDVTFKNPVTNSNVTVEVDGRTLEARLTITRFFPKSDVEGGRVKPIGPLNIKPKLVAVAA